MIKRFFECLIPITQCNLRCEYCYVRQLSLNDNKQVDWKYTPEQIGDALSIDRLGGVCYFSLCGKGETLIPKEMPSIIHNLLKQGHYVNVTTNGTITRAFKQICSTIEPALLKHLHFAFSFHYLELERLNLLTVFSDNVHLVKSAGCSFVVQMNMYDGYEPFLEEIKKYSVEQFGALPQLAATRKYEDDINFHTKYTPKEYYNIGKQFESPLWEVTISNFNRKRHEFCYAGQWSSLLNLATGEIHQCYANGNAINIFDDISSPIPFKPVGKCCSNVFCVNSSHFLSLGVIPEVMKNVSYASLRDRPEAQWYSDEMKEFLSGKLEDNNSKYNFIQKSIFNVETGFHQIIKGLGSIRHRLISKIKKTFIG